MVFDEESGCKKRFEIVMKQNDYKTLMFMLTTENPWLKQMTRNRVSRYFDEIIAGCPVLSRRVELNSCS